jgi:hypothetical protein
MSTLLPRPLVFVASLTGAQEVPPVATPATGAARVFISPDQSFMQVLLAVTNIRQVHEAHIHLGRPGQNGPIVTFIFGSTQGIDAPFPILLTNRTFTARDLAGPLFGMPLSALVAQMLSGNTYINVHTNAHPDGEIRGQLTRL